MPTAPGTGLKNSPLHLNLGLGLVEIWNEEAIKSRAKTLADRALLVWTWPSLSSDIVESYRVKRVGGEEFSIDSHPALLSPKLRPIYEGFRHAMLALDACVTEEFKRHLVAYKGESSFVFIIPRADRLKLYLNMRFSDVVDPKARCRDASKVSHWGRGDVELDLTSLEDLSYVVGLARQAFDHQFDGDDE